MASDETRTGLRSARTTVEWVAERLRSGDLGMSSTSLMAFALDGEASHLRRPADHTDLGRCERLFERATEHDRARMLPVLAVWRQKVWERYPERWCDDCRGAGCVPSDDRKTWVECAGCKGHGWLNRRGEPTRRPTYASAR